MKIYADGLNFKVLNDKIRHSEESDIQIEGCLGQRYIGSGLSNKKITINGIAGNALAAYLNDSEITVNGNAQDATGDTMNEGMVVIHGNAGDATGYAMRGGKIFVHGDTGYRAGIHMKQYKEKRPLLLIGGSAGSFLGEYQAGGTIVVLGLNTDKTPVGNFCGTGMHGGKIYLRCEEPPRNLPSQVAVAKANESDIKEIAPELRKFCALFNESMEVVLSKPFWILSADTKNPYKQLYTAS